MRKSLQSSALSDHRHTEGSAAHERADVLYLSSRFLTFVFVAPALQRLKVTRTEEKEVQRTTVSFLYNLIIQDTVSYLL